LVVDVLVRQGRSIDAADEEEGAGNVLPEGKEGGPETSLPVNETGRRQGADVTDRRLPGAALGLGGTYLVYSVSARGESRIDRIVERLCQRPLTKARRLLRRLR